jgi:GTPase SAR1 family protein
METDYVIGPPGTGKTHYIEKLIRERGTQNYVYLTYNRSMAREARSRIGGDESHIGTVHSIMAKMNGFGPYLKSEDQIEWAEQMGLTYPKKKSMDDDGKTELERFLAWYDASYQLMRGFRQPLGERLNMGFLKDSYESMKRKAKKMDYTDILVNAVEGYYRTGDLYVDEAQDFTPLMWSIIDRFDADTLTVVGDPSQSIYSFKGVSLTHFVNRIKKTDYKVLQMTHRYSSSLVELADRALGMGKVIPASYTGTGITEIDRYSMRQFPMLEGTKAILTRTNQMAQWIANNFDFAVVPIKKEHSYANGWTKRAFEIGRIMKEWPPKKPEDFRYIVEHSPASLWQRGTKAKVRREPTIFSYDMMKRKLTPQDIIGMMDIRQNEKENAIRLTRENVPVVFCDTIHAAKGLEFAHVMLVMDIPKKIEMDFSPEEHRILYVGMTRARKSLNFVYFGELDGTYYIPGHVKTIYA